MDNDMSTVLNIKLAIKMPHCKEVRAYYTKFNQINDEYILLMLVT